MEAALCEGVYVRAFGCMRSGVRVEVLFICFVSGFVVFLWKLFAVSNNNAYFYSQ